MTTLLDLFCGAGGAAMGYLAAHGHDFDAVANSQEGRVE